jgi:hypothetical protein
MPTFWDSKERQKEIKAKEKEGQKKRLTQRWLGRFLSSGI